MTASSVAPASIGSIAAWEAAACSPSAGSGLVARVGAVVLVAAAADDEALAPILDHAQIVAANGGSGRQLVRGFALQLASLTGDPPSFVAVAPIDRGLAVFAIGDATAEVDGERISGRESLAWVEKVVPWPVSHVAMYVDQPATPAVSPLLDLRDGVIAASGCTLTGDPGAAVEMPLQPEAADVGSQGEQAAPPELVAQDMGRHRRASDQVPRGDVRPAVQGQPAPAAAPPPPAPPSPPPVPAEPTPAEPTPAVGIGQVAPPPGPPVARRPAFTPEPVEDSFESVLIGPGALDVVSEPKPLPVAEKAGHSRVSIESAPVVKGVFCKNGHFNDPRMLFCGVCGINMVQQTPVLVDGARPPLGVIVLDDGAVFQVDTDYLLGRDPDSDERMTSGSWRAIQLTDTQNTISRVHARLELRHWDVVLVDDESTNGTFFAEPKSAQWVPVPRGQEQVLQPGWRIRIGHRTLAFNTHRG